MTPSQSSLNTKSISRVIEVLRSFCQVDIMSSWQYQETDEVITDFMPFSLTDWQPVELNEKVHISWAGETRYYGWGKNSLFLRIYIISR